MTSHTLGILLASALLVGAAIEQYQEYIDAVETSVEVTE